MRKFGALLFAAAALAGASGAARAADLIVYPDQSMGAGIVDVGGDWEGVYLGLYGGYGWGDADDTSGSNDVDMAGWLAGVTAGADFYLMDGLVVGIAGDLAWSDIGGTNESPIGYDEISHHINWTGSVRGRVGADLGMFMPYFTAGVAVANATRSSVGPSDSADATHIGWTAGLGAEVAVTDTVSVDLQYRVSDFGEEMYNGVDNATVGLTTHAVTAGVNFRF
jgi:outer membrane immunogenic protein